MLRVPGMRAGSCPTSNSTGTATSPHGTVKRNLRMEPDARRPKRLTVLFITNWYPTREEPTRAVWVREYAKAVRLYDDVAVLHSAGPDLDLKRLWRLEEETGEGLREGIPTYRVSYRPSPVPGTSYFAYAWSLFRAFQHLVRHGVRPDIIHVHVYDAGAPAVLIGKLYRVPVVVSEHFS